MYTAKITKKEAEGAAIRVFVEFSDGTTSVTESCVPQNEDGLKYWVKSRLETFNAAKDIETKYPSNAVIDVSAPVVAETTPTADEIAERAWFRDYNKWVMIKKTLIDTNVLTGNEAPLVTLLNRVKANFKAAYLDKIG